METKTHLPQFDSIQKSIRNNLIFFVLLALLIRILWIPFTLHTDLRFTGDIIEFNFKAFTAQSSDVRNLWYPPIFYFSIRLIQSVISPEGLFFFHLPNQGKEAQIAILSAPEIFRTLTLLKSWYLIFDLGVAFVLWKLMNDEDKRAALLLWLFCPLVIYNAYFHGQFDLVPVFFVVLGLLYAKNSHANWGVLFLGIGTNFKYYPFLFLLPLIIIYAKTWKARLKLLLWGILPLIVLTIPHIQNSIKLNKYPQWFFKASYDLGFGAQVYFFFIFYAVLLWYLFYNNPRSFESFWRTCFAILLIYYQFSYFDLHYWIWVVPFAIIYLVKYTEEAKPFYLVIGLCLIMLLASTPLARFLAPVSPRFFLRLPSLLELFNPYLPMLFLINVVRSLLAGTCFYLAWKLVRGIPATRNRISGVTTDPITTT